MPEEFWEGAGSRGIVRRIVLQGDLVLVTPAAFGSGEEGDLVDLPLLLDPLDQRPLLTGDSLAGALRSHLRGRDRGYRAPVDQARERQTDAVRLFGGVRADDAGEQSPLVVEDALGTDARAESRDGVRIDPRSRTAADDKLFNRLVWEAGTRFGLRFELIVGERAGAQALEQALATALAGFDDGSIRLGARKGRGYGQARTENWRARAYDLTDPQQLLDWLVRGHLDLTGTASPTAREALGLASLSTTDHRRYCDLEACFRLEYSLLIRSGAAQDDRGPDVVHLHSRRDGQDRPQPILTGTGAGGALRARAHKIARTRAAHLAKRLGQDRAGAERRAAELVAGVFGDDLDDLPRGQPPRASRLIVDERVIDDPIASRVHTRTSIDRFTSGVIAGRLFSEQPLFAKPTTSVRLKCRLINPTDAEIGLLLLVLKDLWNADLPLGGQGGVGRGRLSGRWATLDLCEPGRTAERSWQVRTVSDGLTISDPAGLNAFVATALRGYFDQHLAGGVRS